MPFQRSRFHLVSGAKQHKVCSVKACKVGVWFGIKCGSVPLVYVILITRLMDHYNKNKNGSLNTNLSRNTSSQSSQPHPIFPFCHTTPHKHKVLSEISFHNLVSRLLLLFININQYGTAEKNYRCDCFYLRCKRSVDS